MALFNALSFPSLADETPDSLRVLTGVAFEYGSSGAASGAYSYSGTGGRHAAGAGSRQWCPTCTNAGTHYIGGVDRPCFLDPREQVNVPASVWVDKARVAAITKGRDANARDLGITAGKLVPPSADAIKRYEDYAKDSKGGGKGGGRRGGGRGGGGRGGGAHAGAHVEESTCEWRDSLADLTVVTVDDTLLMDIADKRAGVDDAAALEAVADPADTNEDETAVDDEASLSGTREIDWNGSLIDDDTLNRRQRSRRAAGLRCSTTLTVQSGSKKRPSTLRRTPSRAAATERPSPKRQTSSSGREPRPVGPGGLPSTVYQQHAASTTPQAPQAELAATTSPALPPTTPGAPGYLGSSVSAEFPSLGSACFVGGTGPGGDYAQVPAKYYSHITASAEDDGDGIGDSAYPGDAVVAPTPPAKGFAPATAPVEEWSTRLPSSPALASELDTTVKFTPAPATRSLMPPLMRDVTDTPINQSI